MAAFVIDRQRLRDQPQPILADPVVVSWSGPASWVTAELRLGRSPVAIWADLVADKIEDRVCGETIYAAVFAN